MARSPEPSLGRQARGKSRGEGGSKGGSQNAGKARGGAQALDDGAVRSAYARWAPVYDVVFGAAFNAGRRAAVTAVNALPPGRILECGVGTGLSLPAYRRDHRLTGIDLSPDMLAVAGRRVREKGLFHVEALIEADAGRLPFATGVFDAAILMFVMTVVPDAEAVLAEIARVTRPGGRIIMVSHFTDEAGWRKRLAASAAPVAAKLGWHADFPVGRVMGHPELMLRRRRRVGPLGFFTLLEFERS